MHPFPPVVWTLVKLTCQVVSNRGLYAPSEEVKKVIWAPGPIEVIPHLIIEFSLSILLFFP